MAQTNPEFTFDHMFKEYAKARGLNKEDFFITQEKAISIMESYNKGQELAFEAVRTVCATLYPVMDAVILKHAKDAVSQNGFLKSLMIESCCKSINNALPGFRKKDAKDFGTYFSQEIENAVQAFMQRSKKLLAENPEKLIPKKPLKYHISEEDYEASGDMTPELMSELKKMLSTGKQLMSDATEEMYLGLRYFITRRIRKNAKSYIASHPDAKEELENECFVAIVEGMKSYDPLMSMATTYFCSFIDGHINSWKTAELAKDNTRSHTDGMKQVKEAIVTLEANGIKNWTSSQISMFTGLNIRRVEDILNMMKIGDTKSLSELMDEQGDSPSALTSSAPSVEDQVYQNDLFHKLYNAILTLPRVAQSAVIITYGFNGGPAMSVAQTTKIINREFDTNYSELEVASMVEQAIKGLSQNHSLSVLNPNREKKKTYALNKVGGINQAASAEKVSDMVDAMTYDPDDVEYVTLEFGLVKEG